MIFASSTNRRCALVSLLNSGRKTFSASTLGRATTAVRGVGRASKERDDVKRAQENVDVAKTALEELDATIAEETAAIAARFDAAAGALETVSVAPKRGQVLVQAVALGWRAESRKLKAES